MPPRGILRTFAVAASNVTIESVMKWRQEGRSGCGAGRANVDRPTIGSRDGRPLVRSPVAQRPPDGDTQRGQAVGQAPIIGSVSAMQDNSGIVRFCRQRWEQEPGASTSIPTPPKVTAYHGCTGVASNMRTANRAAVPSAGSSLRKYTTKTPATMRATTRPIATFPRAPVRPTSRNLPRSSSSPRSNSRGGSQGPWTQQLRRAQLRRAEAHRR
jgi:hypothetical protein